MRELLGLPLDVLYCPHGAGPPVCWCRKPLPGLGVVFIQRHALDPARCVYVGAGAAGSGLRAEARLRVSRGRRIFWARIGSCEPRCRVTFPTGSSRWRRRSRRSASPAPTGSSSASSTASACSRSSTAATCGCCRATACRRTIVPRSPSAIAALPVGDAILDGEATWDGQAGGVLPRVRRPVARRRRDWRLPLEERRALLRALPLEPPLARVAAARGRPSRGSARAREGWEGVIAKRRDSPYEHRRSPHWLKMKCEATQELVVGGFTDPQGARVGLGALLVGYFEGDDFVFAGKVGTGFDTKLLLDAARAARRARDPERRRSRGRRACRACARTGSRRRSSSRSRSSSGPATASCAIRGCSACAPTRRRATSSGSARDHASREGAVSGRHGITKGELAAYYEAIAPLMLPHLRGRPVTMERFPAGIGAKGLLPEGRRRRAFPTGWSASRSPKKDGTVHYPLVRRRALAALARQPELHHAARLDVARAAPLLPRRLRLRSRSAADERRARRAARRGARVCAICWPSSGCRAGSRPPARRASTSSCRSTARPRRRGRAVRARGRRAAGQARSGSPDAGVQQGRPRRPHPGRHRPQRLQRDLRRRLRRARASPARRCRRRARWEEIERGEVGPQTFTLRTMPRSHRRGRRRVVGHERSGAVAARSDRAPAR